MAGRWWLAHRLREHHRQPHPRNGLHHHVDACLRRRPMIARGHHLPPFGPRGSTVLGRHVKTAFPYGPATPPASAACLGEAVDRVPGPIACCSTASVVIRSRAFSHSALVPAL